RHESLDVGCNHCHESRSSSITAQGGALERGVQMMLRALTSFGIQAVLVVAAVAQRSQIVVVDAVCVAPDGTTLAGVEFAEHWQWHEGVWQGALPKGSEPARLVSDEHGRLRGTWTQSPFSG